MKINSSRREFLRGLGLGVLAYSLGGSAALADGPNGRKRNIIFILADDLGYGDLGCYGGKKIKTPRIDKMASEGMRFTSFYTQPICGPTRTAIMTGCYPIRVAEYENVKRHHPFVHLDEVFIPELLAPAGYTSACIGKWDLNGHRDDFPNGTTPKKHGFDYFFVRPSSDGPIYDNDKLIGEVDTAKLTRLYTDKALEFIESSKDRPFFLYLAHTMPHVPLAVSEDFKGKSSRGLYGDVVEELDWNVGRVLDKVKQLGLDDNTLVIFASDNGPWPFWTGADQSGSAGPLRGQKCETWEGGVRVPFIARSPGLIEKGKQCDQMIGDVDMLPTFARLAGVEVPRDRVIDGRDVLGLMTGEMSKTPVKARYYYYDTHLQAVRAGKWKLILTRPKRPPWLTDEGKAENWRGRDVEEIAKPQLYDLESDIGESTDLTTEQPQVVKRLLALAERARADMGDYDRIGTNARFFDKQKPRPDVAKWKKK